MKLRKGKEAKKRCESESEEEARGVKSDKYLACLTTSEWAGWRAELYPKSESVPLVVKLFRSVSKSSFVSPGEESR